MKNKIALVFPWLNLYGGGEVFCEYTANLLIKKYEIDLYVYNNEKNQNKKLDFNKRIKIKKIKSRSFFVHYFCSRFMIFAHTYLIFYFNNINKEKYKFILSTIGEFFSKTKTIQYIHMCIFSKNIFEYKNFGLTSPFKMVVRFIFVIFSRFLLGLNKKKFFNVITLTNSKWSLQRLKKTYLIKVKKVVYPTFKVPSLVNNSYSKFSKRPNNFVILGRVSEDKRIIDGLKIFNEIKKSIRNAKLHIIGPIDINYFKKIQKFINSNSIIFHGLINLRKRNKILLNSKYGLNFFHSEHFGRNVLEMQKLGMIVFARNAGGVREIIFNRNQLYNNSFDLIKKIKLIHFNKDKILKIIHNNKKNLKQNFSDKIFQKNFLSNF